MGFYSRKWKECLRHALRVVSILKYADEHRTCTWSKCFRLASNAAFFLPSGTLAKLHHRISAWKNFRRLKCTHAQMLRNNYNWLKRKRQRSQYMGYNIGGQLCSSHVSNGMVYLGLTWLTVNVMRTIYIVAELKFEVPVIVFGTKLF